MTDHPIFGAAEGLDAFRELARTLMRRRPHWALRLIYRLIIPALFLLILGLLGLAGWLLYRL